MQHQDNQTFEHFDSFESFFEQAEQRPGYWIERAKLDFTKEIIDKMEQRGVAKSELAQRLQVRPGMVTRLLSGHNNFELATMVRIAMALNCRYRSHLEPVGSKTVWFDVVDCASHQESKPPSPGEYGCVEVFYPKMISLNYATESAAA